MKSSFKSAVIPYHSPLGWLHIHIDDDDVSHIVFAKQKGKVSARIHDRFPKKLLKELDLYFMGESYTFKIDMSLHGTAFQREVWNSLKTIPYGETRTYGEIAKHVGHPKAYRAVGSACKHNPVPILIPCHRVVPARYKTGLSSPNFNEVGEYAGGVEKKKWLLRHEKRHCRQTRR